MQVNGTGQLEERFLSHQTSSLECEASLHLPLQIMLLAAALIIAQVMVRRKISVVGDSAVALLLGLIAGVFFFYLDLSATYLAWCVSAFTACPASRLADDVFVNRQCLAGRRIGFSRDFFFTALLPPM
jgi:uncharacterized membrane protein YGL010W